MHLFHLGTQIIIMFSKAFLDIPSKVRRTARMTLPSREKMLFFQFPVQMSEMEYVTRGNARARRRRQYSDESGLFDLRD
jgi:hypothetical protein